MTISDFRFPTSKWVSVRDASLVAIALLGVWSLTRASVSEGQAAAQEPASDRPVTVAEPPQDAVPQKSNSEPSRANDEFATPQTPVSGDPTDPGDDLQKVLRQMKPNQAPKAVARPTMPKITLRGRVFATEDEGVALLEIDKQLFRIRTGQELRLSSGNATLTIRAEEVSSRIVRLVIDPLNLQLEL